jgi:hypothetical protein
VIALVQQLKSDPCYFAALMRCMKLPLRLRIRLRRAAIKAGVSQRDFIIQLLISTLRRQLH